MVLSIVILRTVLEYRNNDGGLYTTEIFNLRLLNEELLGGNYKVIFNYNNIFIIYNYGGYLPKMYTFEVIYPTFTKLLKFKF